MDQVTFVFILIVGGIVGLIVWLYTHLSKREQAKPEHERQLIKQERAEHNRGLWKVGGIVLILAGIGLGGFSIVPETPADFPLGARLFLIVLGIGVMVAVNRKTV